MTDWLILINGGPPFQTLTWEWGYFIQKLRIYNSALIIQLVVEENSCRLSD